MDKTMQEALAMDAAMLESMGAGPQPLAFAQDEIWMQLDDALLGKWSVWDEGGELHGQDLTQDEARSMCRELTKEPTPMTIPTDEAVERVAKAIRDQNRIHMQRNNPSRTFTRDELTEDETQLARAAIAAMQPSVAAVEPDFCYDPCEWEYTHPWAERNDMMDGWYGTPLKVETLHKGAPKWGVEVALDTDGDGEEDDWEFQWFDSEEAAIHALAKGATDDR